MAYTFKYQASVITQNGISIQINAYQKDKTKRIFYAMTYKNVFLIRTMYSKKYECESQVYALFEKQFDNLQNAIHKINFTAHNK